MRGSFVVVGSVWLPWSPWKNLLVTNNNGYGDSYHTFFGAPGA